jgi:hypothetical protein
VHVLRNMISSVKPGGLVLDLQVIRPNPRVEVDDRSLCEIDGTPLFRLADAAAAVDAAVADGRLREEALDDHDVRKHYRTGVDLVDDFAGKERKLPAAAIPVVRAVTRPCIVREGCRLRRLGGGGAESLLPSVIERLRSRGASGAQSCRVARPHTDEAIEYALVTRTSPSRPARRAAKRPASHACSACTRASATVTRPVAYRRLTRPVRSARLVSTGR